MLPTFDDIMKKSEKEERELTDFLEAFDRVEAEIVFSPPDPKSFQPYSPPSTVTATTLNEYDEKDFFHFPLKKLFGINNSITQNKSREFLERTSWTSLLSEPLEWTFWANFLNEPLERTSWVNFLNELLERTSWTNFLSELLERTSEFRTLRCFELDRDSEAIVVSQVLSHLGLKPPAPHPLVTGSLPSPSTVQLDHRNESLRQALKDLDKISIRPLDWVFSFFVGRDDVSVDDILRNGVSECHFFPSFIPKLYLGLEISALLMLSFASEQPGWMQRRFHPFFDISGLASQSGRRGQPDIAGWAERKKYDPLFPSPVVSVQYSLCFSCRVLSGRNGPLSVTVRDFPWTGHHRTILWQCETAGLPTGPFVDRYCFFSQKSHFFIPFLLRKIIFHSFFAQKNLFFITFWLRKIIFSFLFCSEKSFFIPFLLRKVIFSFFFGSEKSFFHSFFAQKNHFFISFWLRKVIFYSFLAQKNHFSFFFGSEKSFFIPFLQKIHFFISFWLRKGILLLHFACSVDGFDGDFFLFTIFYSGSYLEDVDFPLLKNQLPKTAKARSYSVDDVDAVVGPKATAAVAGQTRPRKHTSPPEPRFVCLFVWMETFRDDFVFPAGEKSQFRILASFLSFFLFKTFFSFALSVEMLRRLDMDRLYWRWHAEEASPDAPNTQFEYRLIYIFPAAHGLYEVRLRDTNGNP